jgi:hypothetical protein
MLTTVDPNDPFPSATPRSNTGLLVLGVLLGLSAIGNVALVMRGPTVVERRVEVPAPAPPPAVATPTECPPAPQCPTCAPCPEPVVAERPTGGGGSTTPRPPRPPPIDQDAATEGEAHVAHAETVAERDPVQVAAQRRVADGIDRLVASHSPASAERFIQRTLPSFASMDCAFRDPAAAEHVRMQLRPLNAIARPGVRLSEADLTRYERDLRCPRE